MRMRMPRVTLGRMMAAVALVGANAALLRAAVRADIQMPLVVGPPFLLLEVAAWRARRDRRPGRAFWVGYLVLGGIVTGSAIWALTHSAEYGMLPNGTYGLVRPGSVLSVAWLSGCQWGIQLLMDLAALVLGRDAESVELVLAILVFYAPQIGAGIAGGLIGRGLGHRRHARVGGCHPAARPEGAKG
jgi:hypothetical protein